MLETNKHIFRGIHVFGEIYGVESSILNDFNYLNSLLEKGIEKSHAHIEGSIVKQFDPNGVTIVFLLSESHASIHTYPEHHSLFFDAFTCGSKCDPTKIIDEFLSSITYSSKKIKIIERGL